MPLESFVRDHIRGLQNLINFSLQSPRQKPPAFLFCSSVASVINASPNNLVLEKIYNDPESASSLGYSRSKWVAEKMCDQAQNSTRLRGRIVIVRVGQLCGDTEKGIWNANEAWPLMLSSMTRTRSLPDLDDVSRYLINVPRGRTLINLRNKVLAWFPIDLAAAAILEIATHGSGHKLGSEDESKIQVYHLFNNDKTARWVDLLAWLRRLSPLNFDIVPPSIWVERLKSMEARGESHPSLRLLNLWRQSYAPDISSAAAKTNLTFDTRYTEQVAPTLKKVGPITEEHFKLIYRWMERSMGINEEVG